MAERSKRISLSDPEKRKQINPETLKYFEKYQIDMSIRELSLNSIIQYNADLIQWFIFMYDKQFNLSVLEAKDEDLEEYFYWRKQQGNNTNRQKRVMSSISAFYKFLRKKKMITESPTEFIDRPKAGQPITQQTYLTMSEVKLMRQVLIDKGDLQLLIYAFISLFTMARVNAIAHLKWEQIDLDNLICKDVLEKEGKVVELYLNDEIVDYLKKLKQYRIDNKIEDYGWLFITNSTNEKNCITNGTLDSWCKIIGIMIGEPSLHPHDFRHSYATLLKNEAGMSLEDVSTLLHHESTDTTKKFYLKIDNSKIKERANSFKIG